MIQQNARKDVWGNLFFWLVVGPFALLAALPAIIAGAANILSKLLLTAGIAALLAIITIAIL